MKSIGIYGDSFCRYHDGLSAPDWHWTHKLPKHYGCSSEIYGIGGSSIYYSYKKFVENYSKHDLNIFLVSEPNRFPGNATDRDGTTIYPTHGMIPILNVDTNVKNALTGFYECNMQDFFKDMAELMLNDILNRDSSVIFVSCFDACNALEPVIKKTQNNKVSLWTLVDTQLKILSNGAYNGDDFNRFTENLSIYGHLIPEMSDIVFDMLCNMIENNSCDFGDFQNINATEKFDFYYFKKVENV